MRGFNFLAQSSLLEELHVHLLSVRPADVEDLELESLVTHMYADYSAELYAALIPRCTIASNMRSLKFIGGIFKAPATSILLEELYDSLRAMPLLDTLIIENALEISGPAASDIIYLPHLTYFTLMGPGEIVAALYTSVQPHTHATIGLDFDDDIQGTTTLLHAETVASALRTHVARNGAPSYDDLELRQSGGHGRDVILFDLWSFKAGEEANIIFSCSFPTNVDGGSIGKDIFGCLTGALRKADIRQLRLCMENGPTPAVPDLMKDIFCDATSVEYLLILGDTIRFLDLLDVSSSSDDTMALFFPRLNRVNPQRLRCSRNGLTRDHTPPSPPRW